MEPLVDLCIARVKRAGQRMRRSERAGSLDDLRVARWMLGRLGLKNPQLDSLIRDIERELRPDGLAVETVEVLRGSGHVLPLKTRLSTGVQDSSA